MGLCRATAQLGNHAYCMAEMKDNLNNVESWAESQSVPTPIGNFFV